MCRGFSYVNEELYVKNKTEVKINVNKDARKMGELLERGRNLRRFVIEIVIISWIGILLLPISWAFAKWLFSH